MVAETDMFGNPIEALRERRGRPSYAKTQENQRFVEVRAAAGWTQKMIAADMGIDEDTLRKHFSAEMEMGQVKVQGMLLDVLLQKARAGHVPSVRHLQDHMAKAAPAAPRRPKADVDKPVVVMPKGKKALELDAAQQVPVDYGDIFAARQKRH